MTINVRNIGKQMSFGNAYSGAQQLFYKVHYDWILLHWKYGADMRDAMFSW